MALPKISIVTTSYNQGQYLDQCIRSVIEQDYPNLEYIVVDGGSKDDSADVIRRHEKRLAWWCSEKDGGQSNALNKGFGRATGDVMGFINSDDFLEPGALRAVGERFERGAKWVAGWVKFIEPDGGEFPQVWQSFEQPQDWFVTNPLPQQGTFWAGELWKRHGGFREELDFVFDYEFWMRLRFVAGVMPETIKRCLGVYRLHPDSKTCSRGELFHVENERIRHEYMGLLQSRELRKVKAHRRRWLSKRSNRLGWTALAESNVKKARAAARDAVWFGPFSLNNWRMMCCALRGR